MPFQGTRHGNGVVDGAVAKQLRLWEHTSALWRHAVWIRIVKSHNAWMGYEYYQTWIAQGRFINMIRTPSKQWGVCYKLHNRFLFQLPIHAPYSRLVYSNWPTVRSWVIMYILWFNMDGYLSIYAQLPYWKFGSFVLSSSISASKRLNWDPNGAVTSKQNNIIHIYITKWNHKNLNQVQCFMQIHKSTYFDKRFKHT